jgi:hypothetical protein
MVAFFKMSRGKVPAYQITRDNVEDLLGRRPPWFQGGQMRGDDRHFAVCPYCDTPIQLIGLYKRHDRSPRPYGSHTGTAINGFPFSAVDVEFCPYKLKGRSYNKTSRREPGPVARQLIDMAVAEFDRIVLILRDDFGFAFSDTWACQMLEKWFDSEAYCYMGAHLGNLPWMIAYFAPALNLYGQAIGTESELAQHIRINVPHAGISAAGRLEKGRGFYRLDLQSLHHKAVVDASDGSFTEQLTLRVQDFTKTNEASRAPTIFKKQIVFSPARFEALIHTPPERAKRNENLLGYAQAIATKRGHDVSIISKTD